MLPPIPRLLSIKLRRSLGAILILQYTESDAGVGWFGSGTECQTSFLPGHPPGYNT